MTEEWIKQKAIKWQKENCCTDCISYLKEQCNRDVVCGGARGYIAGATETTKGLKEENEKLHEQVNTYLEMLANETKKHIPDSKGCTIWDKSLIETIKELQEENDKLKECLRHIVYMAESGLHTKNEFAFARFIAEAKDLLKE